jgi:hypothetical protein
MILNQKYEWNSILISIVILNLVRRLFTVVYKISLTKLQGCKSV